MRTQRLNPAALQLVVAGAGAGKTRLAAQLCYRLAERGWLTGFLANRTPAEAIASGRQLGEPPAPTSTRRHLHPAARRSTR